VDAEYTGRYGFDLRAATKLTFKIVPVPPRLDANEMKIAPDLVGKSVETAREVLSVLELSSIFRAEDTDGNDYALSVQDNHIIFKQEPPARELMPIEAPMQLTIQVVLAPDFISRRTNIGTAKRKLQAMGINCMFAAKDASGRQIPVRVTETQVIIDQIPEPGKMIPTNGRMTLFVKPSASAVREATTKNPSTPVPKS